MLVTQGLSLFSRCEGHRSDIDAIAFSPNGEFIASVCSSEIRLWAVSTGELLWTLNHNESESRKAVGFSTDSMTVCLCYHEYPGVNIMERERLLGFWDISTGKARSNYIRHISTLHFDPSSEERVVTGFGSEYVEVDEDSGNPNSTNRNEGCGPVPGYKTECRGGYWKIFKDNRLLLQLQARAVDKVFTTENWMMIGCRRELWIIRDG